MTEFMRGKQVMIKQTDNCTFIGLYHTADEIGIYIHLTDDQGRISGITLIGWNMFANMTQLIPPSSLN